MKLTSDDALDAMNAIITAKNWLEDSLKEARRLLQREDLPEPHMRFDLVADAADAAEAELSATGDVGIYISEVINVLETLVDELPHD